MSIFPATDIISDVARAADPGKARLAMKRLEEMGGERALGPEAFSFRSAAPARPSSAAQTSSIDSGAASGARSEALTPTQKFEAFILQSWLEDILPKSSDGVYGSEAGADIWRSMMAEQIGGQLARADAVGLRKLLERQNG